MYISCEDYYENYLGDWCSNKCEECFGNKDVYTCNADFEVIGDSVIHKIIIKRGDSFWKISESPASVKYQKVILERGDGKQLILAKELFLKYFNDGLYPDDKYENGFIEALIRSFPGSFINDRNEFIAEPKTNQYFSLEDCQTPLDVECKVLEWLSRSAFKSKPYSKQWRNRKLHEAMLNSINDFLDTKFSEKDMELIYEELGNAINHQKTIRFIESGYDFSVLEE